MHAELSEHDFHEAADNALHHLHDAMEVRRYFLHSALPNSVGRYLPRQLLCSPTTALRCGHLEPRWWLCMPNAAMCCQTIVVTTCPPLQRSLAAEP